MKEEGEICVGGPILALGYYNNLEKTRQDSEWYRSVVINGFLEFKEFNGWLWELINSFLGKINEKIFEKVISNNTWSLYW